MVFVGRASARACGFALCAVSHQPACAALVPTPLPQVRDNIAVHIPCSSKKMGIEETFMKVGGWRRAACGKCRSSCGSWDALACIL